MKRGNYTIRTWVPTTISLGMGFISNEFTGKRSRMNFRQVFLKYVGGTSDFVEMRQIRATSEPEFKRSVTAERRRRS